MNEKKKVFHISLKKVFVFPIAPHTQFRRLVVTIFVLLLLTVALHLYIFYRVQSGKILENQDFIPTPAPKVNIEKLNKILSTYQDKQNVQEEVRQRVFIQDPSL